MNFEILQSLLFEFIRTFFAKMTHTEKEKKSDVKLVQFSGLYGNHGSKRIRFSRNSEGKLRGYLTIKNVIGTGIIMFKVMSTHGKLFEVRPTIGYINHEDLSRSRNIKIVVLDTAEFTGKEKFKVSVVLVHEKEKLNGQKESDLKTTFKELFQKNSMKESWTFDIEVTDEDNREIQHERDKKDSGNQKERADPGAKITPRGEQLPVETHPQDAAPPIEEPKIKERPVQADDQGQDDYGYPEDQWFTPVLETIIELPENSTPELEETRSGSALRELPTDTSFIGDAIRVLNTGSPEKYQRDAEGTATVVTEEGCGAKSKSEPVPQMEASASVVTDERYKLIDQLTRKNETLKQNLEFKDALIFDLKKKLSESKCDSTRESTPGSKSPGAGATESGSESQNENNEEVVIGGAIVSANAIGSTVVALPGSSASCPVAYEVVEFTDKIQFRGEDPTLAATFYAYLDMENRRKIPVSMKLVPSANGWYKLELCLTPFQEFDVPKDTNCGTCVVQLRFLNSMGVPQLCFYFKFDTYGGTCRNHTLFGECRESTFVSKVFTNWAQLSSRDCWVSKLATPGAFGARFLEVNAEVTVMFMKTRNGVLSILPPTLFSDKLDRLIQAAQTGQYLHLGSIKLICGAELDSSWLFRQQLLLDYSPVFRALVAECRISGQPYAEFLAFRNVSSTSMEAFYNYVHGKDDGRWLGNVRLNLELLEFSHSMLIVELAIRCTSNILAMKNEFLSLDDALALIQMGRKLGIECLQNRGIQWMQAMKTAIAEK